MQKSKRLSGISRMVGRSLFGRPATEMYPERRRAYPDAARGSVANDIIRCIFCGQCQRKCPTGAILVAKEEAAWRIDSLKCCSCRRCVEVCPVTASSCAIHTGPRSRKERRAGTRSPWRRRRRTCTIARAAGRGLRRRDRQRVAAPARRSGFSIVWLNDLRGMYMFGIGVMARDDATSNGR